MTAQILREVVETKAGSQSAFARAVGTSPQMVSYWLTNSRPLPAEFVLKAEEAFGVSRHDLRPDIFGPAPAPAPEAASSEAA
jgi:DNA-binding transcriptional regulator YdaS (Cro superfamily)